MNYQRSDNPTDDYARSVVSGATVAGRLVRLACERHLWDLETGHERGLMFDIERAQHALDFFGFLKHSKGEWGGEAFKLQPWQEFIIGSLFGWLRKDGKRRFRVAYHEIPRKNGKTTLAAGVGLYLFCADGEPGSEVFTAATKRDQARLSHGEAARMVKASPMLRSKIGVFKDNLHIERTNSKFEPLGADADTMDGLNIHGAIVDELHAHKTRAIWDVLETATGARRQPLIFAITTAGFDRNSVCWEWHDYSTKILDGIIEDDTVFTYIASLDEGDDWTDQSTWAKANPNLGVSVKIDDLQRKCDKAKEMPSAQNAFLRLHLDMWTEQNERWMPMDKWDECGKVLVIPEELQGRLCYAGLDLSTTTDISALVLCFPDDEGGCDVLPYFWVPEENIMQRSNRDRVPYDLWARQGYIKTTPGNVIDYDIIRRDINQLREQYDINKIAIDRWNSTQLQTQLDGDGFEIVPTGQGFASLSAPTKHLEKLVFEKSLRHGANPVLRWMVSNVAIQQDAAGNIKPAKDKSTERIDGVVAAVMAIDQMTRHGDETSVYDTRGVITIG